MYTKGQTHTLGSLIHYLNGEPESGVFFAFLSEYFGDSYISDLKYLFMLKETLVDLFPWASLIQSNTELSILECVFQLTFFFSFSSEKRGV